MTVRKATDCDLYQNPYQTRCSGSISPDDGVSVCWRHLAASRDEWMARANKAEGVARQYMKAYGLNDDTPKTYEVVGSLYAHECAFRCDSDYGVNCNCGGDCPKHRAFAAVSGPAERKNQHSAKGETR